ncbi:MAG: SDR family oxidoreductase [Caldilineaceae bacterium]
MDLRRAICTRRWTAWTVFHLAAQAGLLRSWDEFDSYMTCNVLATQRLLEAAVANGRGPLPQHLHLVVYGRFATGSNEEAPLEPVSPYGITKLAAVHLCRAYALKDDLPITILRLFSVYGPRQRRTWATTSSSGASSTMN